jgi:hypothetical protein
MRKIHLRGRGICAAPKVYENSFLRCGDRAARTGLDGTVEVRPAPSRSTQRPADASGVSFAIVSPTIDVVFGELPVQSVTQPPGLPKVPGDVRAASCSNDNLRMVKRAASCLQGPLEGSGRAASCSETPVSGRKEAPSCHFLPHSASIRPASCSPELAHGEMSSQLLGDRARLVKTAASCSVTVHVRSNEQLAAPGTSSAGE